MMGDALDLTDLDPWDDEHLARHNADLSRSASRESVETLRFRYDSLFDALPLASGTDTWTRAVGRHRVLLVTTERQTDPSPYVWFHSCGVVLGGPRSALSFASHLAAASQRPVLLPMLRNSPTQRFDEVLDEVVDLAHGLRRMFGDGLWRRAMVGGDCTGSVLALTLAATATPATVALVSPVFDLSRRTGDHVPTGHGDLSAIRAFLGDPDRALDRLDATVVSLDTTHGPSCIVLASAREPAVGDADALTHRMRRAVKLSLRQASSCHASPLFAAVRPDGRAAVEILADLPSRSGGQ